MKVQYFKVNVWFFSVFQLGSVILIRLYRNATIFGITLFTLHMTAEEISEYFTVICTQSHGDARSDEVY